MENLERNNLLERIKLLAECIEAGNEEEVNRILDDILQKREHMLFQELGRLTREFHDALNSFRLDSRVTELARDNIPDAKQRLNYVISMTEQAANRTLNAVEGTTPICEKIAAQSRMLREQWANFIQRKMTAQDFRNMSRELDSFLENMSADTDRIRVNLSEVLMAQDYQDLTGQILQRVIFLVNEMEGHLSRLVRNGSAQTPHDPTVPPLSFAPLAPKTIPDKPSAEEAHGPFVPGVIPAEEVIHNQDDVDSLLSSLGF